MSFQQGLSGLNAASKNLDVIGNNVANANTVGFKASQAQFADVYASVSGGAVGTAIGIGTKLSTVAQQFTQGNVTSSNNPMDMAINGTGFFQLADAGGSSAQYYSRNGQFQADKQGHIVTSDGKWLIGKTASIGGTGGVVGPIIIPTADIPARATGDSTLPAALKPVQVGLNLDARKPVTTVDANNAPQLVDPNQASSYNDSTSTTVFDSLGTPHVATMYFQRGVPAAAENPWKFSLAIDGIMQPDMISGNTVTPLTFDTSGKVSAGGLQTMSQPFPNSTVSAAQTASKAVYDAAYQATIAGGGSAAQAALDGANAALADISAALKASAAITNAQAAVDAAITAVGGTPTTDPAVLASIATAAQAAADGVIALAGPQLTTTAANSIAAQAAAAAKAAVIAQGGSTFLAQTVAAALSSATNGAIANQLTLSFDFANPLSPTTQYGSSFGVNTMVQDGNSTGQPTGVSVDQTGVVVGRYSNGQTQPLGVVELATFKNPQGLQPLGNNRWARTALSGDPLVNPPGAAGVGVIQAGAVEDANVDLTAELVNMIVAQRVYQANAQSIKTQDAVLQTITNLR